LRSSSTRRDKRDSSRSRCFYLTALLAQLSGDPGEHLAVLRLLAQERGALGTARRLDRGDLGVSAPRSRLDLLQARQVGAQLSDEFGLRAGNVAVVVQLARDAAGLLARRAALRRFALR